MLIIADSVRHEARDSRRGRGLSARVKMKA
jgi:hypothetical protein